MFGTEMGHKRAKETAGGVVFLKNTYAVSTRKLNYFLGVSPIHKPEMVKEFSDFSQVWTKPYL